MTLVTVEQILDKIITRAKEMEAFRIISKDRKMFDIERESKIRINELNELVQSIKNDMLIKDSEEKLTELTAFETLLNEHSGKRYHINAKDNWKFELVEVTRMDEKKIIVDDLNADFMLAWLKIHLVTDIVRA